MLTDVQTLVLSALLAWLMFMTGSALRTRLWTLVGLQLAFGNREQVPDAGPLAGRAGEGGVVERRRP